MSVKPLTLDFRRLQRPQHYQTYSNNITHCHIDQFNFVDKTWKLVDREICCITFSVEKQQHVAWTVAAITVFNIFGHFKIQKKVPEITHVNLVSLNSSSHIPQVSLLNSILLTGLRDWFTRRAWNTTTMVNTTQQHGRTEWATSTMAGLSELPLQTSAMWLVKTTNSG